MQQGKYYCLYLKSCYIDLYDLFYGGHGIHCRIYMPTKQTSRCFYQASPITLKFDTLEQYNKRIYIRWFRVRYIFLRLYFNTTKRF